MNRSNLDKDLVANADIKNKYFSTYIDMPIIFIVEGKIIFFIDC